MNCALATAVCGRAGESGLSVTPSATAVRPNEAELVIVPRMSVRTSVAARENQRKLKFAMKFPVKIVSTALN